MSQKLAKSCDSPSKLKHLRSHSTGSFSSGSSNSGISSSENLFLVNPLRKSLQDGNLIAISSDSDAETVSRSLNESVSREDIIIISDSDEQSPTRMKNKFNNAMGEKSGFIAVEDLASSFSDSTKLGYSFVDFATKNNCKRKISTHSTDNNNKSMKKRAVRFGHVTEVSFPRQQGYSCVPSKGGLTLGMAKKHCSIDHFTIDNYEKKKLHRVYREKLNISSHNNKNYCDKASQNQYLQPISTKERLAILKDAGIEQIDDEEKEDCHFIRSSREICGCECRDYCDPDVCSCILAEIPCQIERPNFPCGCTIENCKNPNGCNIYNLTKVQNHFTKTMKKLKGK